jgi:hypothetical protein
MANDQGLFRNSRSGVKTPGRLVRRLEAFARADGGDHQVERGVLRVAAVFARAVTFAEVSTETALTVIDLQHN